MMPPRTPATAMTRKTVVILAFHYPPMLGPASQRAASFARHLPAAGWDPVVVTVRRGLYHRDSGQESPHVPTLRTASPEPSRLLATLRGRRDGAGDATAEVVQEVPAGAALGRLRRLVRDYLYVPDGQALWIPFAVAAARRAVRSASQPVVLMSTSVPYSAHLAALRVARSEGVAWVAEFRDPWAGIADSLRPRSGARKWIDAELERRVVESANGVVVTTELTRDAMMHAYPALPPQRIAVVRNGFEPAEDSPSPPGAEEPLRLLYAGSVPDDAPIEPLLRGIGQVAAARPGEVRLRVLAPRERWAAVATAVGDPDWIELAGLVSPEEARLEAGAASANLLLRPGAAHRQFVAAKLLEYLGARRPIVAAVDPQGEMATLGREYGDLRLVPEYGEAAVAAEVERLLGEHRAGVLQRPIEPPGDLNDLTRSAGARRLAMVLDSVCAAPLC